MSEALMSTAVRLGSSLDALAALAAHVRIETENLPADPRVRALLADIAVELLGEPGGYGGHAAPVVGLARAFVQQAAELIENPGRVGSWDQINVPLLQSIGRLSMAICDAVRTAAGMLPDLNSRLTAPGADFLDVGTGTGWLAIAMARSYPELRVVGIDIFEPALNLARSNIETERIAGRVEVRRQDVAALDNEAGFDVIWLPMPFLPADIVPAALAAVSGALRPGGWLLAGTFTGLDDRLSSLLTDLRTIRCGGHPWRSDELVPTIAAAGFSDVAEVPRTWPAPARLYVGRRP
ncbi:cyclopropane-fatty-acyl-phospholipid synthase family protein [Frankia sp. Cj3]|uniref:SAM-dependent methyltransferase n=1 Tax=Frankia sp. Cj3 TaxID=2880976 RepID=UPI001EF6C83E|nr:class I SAM-dependent methyltransferase [Frankia sp. Cj3]